jgi:hypothetical protein
MGVRPPGSEADYSPPAIAEVMNNGTKHALAQAFHGKVQYLPN